MVARFLFYTPVGSRIPYEHKRWRIANGPISLLLVLPCFLVFLFHFVLVSLCPCFHPQFCLSCCSRRKTAGGDRYGLTVRSFLLSFPSFHNAIISLCCSLCFRNQLVAWVWAVWAATTTKTTMTTRYGNKENAPLLSVVAVVLFLLLCQMKPPPPYPSWL